MFHPSSFARESFHIGSWRFEPETDGQVIIGGGLFAPPVIIDRQRQGLIDADEVLLLLVAVAVCDVGALL